MYIGTVISLKDDFKGEKKNCLGFCYRVWESKNEFVSGFIFETGGILIMNLSKMNKYIHLEGFKDEMKDYIYENDIKLKKEFENGFFDVIFKDKSFNKYSTD